MKLTFLGTCSGTEPRPGRRHTSFTVETGGGLYWFDAGESCSYTAYLAGVDLLATRAIFNTHTHMDHIGGLPNLLWTLRKLTSLSEQNARRLEGREIAVCTPDPQVWDAVMTLLMHSEGSYACNFTLSHRLCRDGLVYDDGALCVTALHNLHLGEPAPGELWRSFSYRIEAEGKAVVFSGDIRSMEDLLPLLDNTDLLLAETGHHRVPDICNAVKQFPGRIGRLGFVHHGREILENPHAERRSAEEILGEPRVFLADDGMSVCV